MVRKGINRARGFFDIVIPTPLSIYIRNFIFSSIFYYNNPHFDQWKRYKKKAIEENDNGDHPLNIFLSPSISLWKETTLYSIVSRWVIFYLSKRFIFQLESYSNLFITTKHNKYNSIIVGNCQRVDLTKGTLDTLETLCKIYVHQINRQD